MWITCRLVPQMTHKCASRNETQVRQVKVQQLSHSVTAASPPSSRLLTYPHCPAVPAVSHSATAASPPSSRLLTYPRCPADSATAASPPSSRLLTYPHCPAVPAVKPLHCSVAQYLALTHIIHQ